MKNFLKNGGNVLSTIIAVLVILVAYAVLSRESKKELSQMREQCDIKDIVDVNRYTMLILLDKEQVNFKMIVLSQIMQESGWLKDKNCKRRNNYINMKVPYRRYFFGNNPCDFGNYARYDDVVKFVKDIKSWQMSNTYLCYTEEQYYQYLTTNVFAEDKNYISKIKSIYQTLKKDKALQSLL